MKEGNKVLTHDEIKRDFILYQEIETEIEGAKVTHRVDGISQSSNVGFIRSGDRNYEVHTNGFETFLVFGTQVFTIKN